MNSSLSKRSFKEYLLAFSVLIVVAVVFFVVLVSIPYLFFLFLKIFFLTLQFGIVFVVVFWITVVATAWIIKLVSISRY